MDKGDRVLIARGRTGKGATGTIFWMGENKYGDGKRLGVRGDDGETYWVNSDDCDPTTATMELPEASGPEPEKGDRVRWTQGGASGEGRVFWAGQSKHGPGKRYGVEGDDGETRWLDGRFVEKIDGDAPSTSAAPSAAPRSSGAPAPAAAWDPAEEPDDGYIGSAWDGSPPPELGDEPPPPEPPASWDEDDDGGWA